MYQFSVHVQDYDKEFTHALNELKRQVSPVSADRLLFHVCSRIFSVQTLSEMVNRLYEQFHGCRIMCHTVSGGVMDYDYVLGTVISVEIFERPTSRVELYSYDLTQVTDEEIAHDILQFVENNPWVKAIEGHRTVHDMNTTGICEFMSKLPEDIMMFGGLVSSEHIPGNLSYICDQSGHVMDKGVVIIYYGGSDLHIKTYKMSGWKPIDKAFTVTKSEKNIIKEIDGAPASDIYKRYLDISPDDSFVKNVIEFPLLSEDQGHSVIRNVFSLEPDNGFTVAYDVTEGTELKICYADVESVVEDIRAVSREIMQFTPDVISVVSCVTRSLIWQMKDYMPELEGFRTIAPCHGYLSHGEFIREGGLYNHHNTILVATAFREGGLKDVTYPEVSLNTSSDVPLAVRLSTFISRVTDELKDMYSEVEKAATTDALTQIGNRYLFDSAVDAAALDTLHADTKYLLMLDMNNLKHVNDTFGHNEGDRLIKAGAETIADVFSQYGQCFRIGGDEFAVIADFESGAVLQKALDDFHDSMSERNKRLPDYKLSMAVGYSSLLNTRGQLRSGADWKMDADINMYKDKEKFHAANSDHRI